MNIFRKTCFVIIGVLFSICAFAQNESAAQENDFMKMAEEQANGMEIEFGLDYAQVFKIDTLYQRVLPLYQQEMNELQQKGFSNTDIYQQVSDRWNDYIDRILEQIFTPAQWKKFMKSQYGKEKIRRDKRMATYQQTEVQ